MFIDNESAVQGTLLIDSNTITNARQGATGTGGRVGAAGNSATTANGIRVERRRNTAWRLVRPFDLGVKVSPEFAYFLAHPTSMAADARIIAFRDWILDEFRNEAGRG